MVRYAVFASTLCAMMFAGSLPATARYLWTLDNSFCASCAARDGEVATPYAYRQHRAEAGTLYSARPYSRFDIEGIRVIERMR